MAGAARLPTPRSRAPPGPAAGGRGNRRSAVPGLGSQMRGPELGTIFSSPRDCPCRRTRGPATVEPVAPAAGAGAVGLPGAWCLAAAPQIGAATGGAGSSAGLGRRGQCGVSTRKRAWLPPPPASA